MKRKSGFTLVELLVVIGIIALLISILLPALGRVRWQASITACGARMHDLVNAIQIYANDNKGAIPPWAGSQDPVNYPKLDISAGSTFNAEYQFANVTYGSPMDNYPMIFADKKDDGAQLGRLWKMGYLKTSQSFYCPSQRNVDPKNPPAQRDFHNFYTYNPNFKYVDVGGTSLVKPWWKKLNGYGNPSSASKWRNAYYATDMTTPPPVWTRPILVDNLIEYTSTGDKGDVAHRYGNRRAYNLAYADGHVGNYVEYNYMSRTGTLQFSRFVNLANALGDAASGGNVTFSTSAWTNQSSSPYYALPVNPN